MFEYMPRIGIIGLGFVGSAIKDNYFDYSLYLIDTDTSKGYTDTYDDIKDAEGIFVCVPSPQNADGSCNSTILENAKSEKNTYSQLLAEL